MLCKKCKTAVLHEDIMCGYCGTNLRHRSKIPLVIFISAAIAVFLFFVYGEGYMDGIRPTNTADIDSDNMPQEEIGPPENPKPTATPFMAYDSGENQDWMIRLTENIALAASDYIDTGMNYVYYLSKNGYLYDDVNEKYITLSDLTDAEGFDAEYADENVLILYLLTNEFTLTAEEDGNRLRVFSAYETVKGFYLSSSDGYIGIISREALRDLLNKYSQANGKITRFSSSTDEYKDISDAIKRYTNIREPLTIRYLAGDSHYAFAVVSFGERGHEIKEYALIYENDTWSVFAADYEERYDYKSIVNTARPGFNTELFPSYNMYFHLNYLRKDFDDIIFELIERGIVPTGSKPLYASGNDQFSYLEFEGDRKLLCFTPVGIEMSVYSITTYTEGESVMKVLTQDPPYYILKQD